MERRGKSTCIESIKLVGHRKADSHSLHSGNYNVYWKAKLNGVEPTNSLGVRGYPVIIYSVNLFLLHRF